MQPAPSEERQRAEKSKCLRVLGLPASATPWEICEFFAPLMVASVRPPSALPGTGEARAYFELPGHAWKALESSRGKPFGASRAQVRVEACAPEDYRESWEAKQWVCLFDIIDRSGTGQLSSEDYLAARRAGIVPQERFYGTGPLF